MAVYKAPANVKQLHYETSLGRWDRQGHKVGQKGVDCILNLLCMVEIGSRSQTYRRTAHHGHGCYASCCPNRGGVVQIHCNSICLPQTFDTAPLPFAFLAREGASWNVSRYIIVRIMRETLICWSWWLFPSSPPKWSERSNKNSPTRHTHTHTRIVTIACETVNKLFTVHYRETEIDSSIVETPMRCFRNGKEESAVCWVDFFCEWNIPDWPGFYGGGADASINQALKAHSADHHQLAKNNHREIWFRFFRLLLLLPLMLDQKKQHMLCIINTRTQSSIASLRVSCFCIPRSRAKL